MKLMLAPLARRCSAIRRCTIAPVGGSASVAAVPSRSRGRSRADTSWFLAGYAGIAGFFVLEALTRHRGTASSLNASDDDQDTTRVIVTAYALAADLPLLLRRLPVPQLPPIAGPAGLIVQASGLALRAWSMRTLGASYTRTLRTEEQQHVVKEGPYRLVRHPGYAGSLLTWSGFALTSRSVPFIGFVTGLLGWAYQRRITAEEELLRRELPGYAAYSDHTKKLIPFVW
jgi:protein-S-isoprenylcysteine O-methyltransferase Ste14